MSKRILTDSRGYRGYRNAANDEGTNWDLIRVYSGTCENYAVIIADDNIFEGL